MTTILLTRPQRDALWLAASNARHGGLCLNNQRWEVSQNGRWVFCSTVDALVAAGLLRRVGTRRVHITDEGRAALDADSKRSQGRAMPADAKALKQLAADTDDEPVPEITHNADGSIEFTCAGCRQQIFQAVDDGFGFPACFECRWFDDARAEPAPFAPNTHDRPR